MSGSLHKRLGKFFQSQCLWASLAQGAAGNMLDRQRHICPQEPCSPSCPPGAMTHHPAQSACVRKGKSLLESGSCWSLIGCRLLCVCHPPGQSCQGWGQDLATSKPPRHGQCGAAVPSEVWTIPRGLCPMCAHGIAAKG